jgi:hypothetical protein
MTFEEYYSLSVWAIRIADMGCLVNVPGASRKTWTPIYVFPPVLEAIRSGFFLFFAQVLA